jgi:hypothetical protein
MNINNFGKSIIQTHDQNLHLRDVLHVPDASINLVSAHRFTSDNHAFLEIHPKFFCIKDQVTRRVLVDDHVKADSILCPSHHLHHHPKKFMESPSHPIIDGIVVYVIQLLL